MGLSSSTFTREELQEYSDLTYFAHGEIIQLYKKFVSLDEAVSKNNREMRISAKKISSLPELKHNPFADLLCKVFSTADNGTDEMNFDDFLDMMNALSEHASFKLKAQYAFQLFDINEDGFIDSDDVVEIVKRLTKTDAGLEEEGSMAQLCESIMNEADLDNDNKLSLAEFEHVLSKSPDFMNSFKIRI